ncbi:MAG: shikimate kinase [Eubacterium sp.]
MGEKTIALIGYMATGKTTIGKKIAQKLQLKFMDTDVLIQNDQGKSINDIFKSQGEQAFRKMENALLKELLKQENILISTGGGIILNEENRRILKENTFLVTLTAKPESIYRRVQKNSERPLLNSKNTLEKIVQMMEKRGPFYTIGDLIIQTDQLEEEACVKKIISAYQNSFIEIEKK